MSRQRARRSLVPGSGRVDQQPGWVSTTAVALVERAIKGSRVVFGSAG
ncbi:hypothetical protein [Synechococcus sp. MIT S9509]|nr:hypothetical protein [Synechococcus sp. MIT S9509]